MTAPRFSDDDEATRPAIARPSGLRRRFWRITLFFLHTFLTLYFWEVLLPRRLKLGIARRNARERRRRLAAEFRDLAVEMGGVMIKLGQFFSARVDVLPPEVTDTLSDLQDEVQPVPWPLIEGQIVRELGRPPDEVYATFLRMPVGAASLGQVHYATLADGAEVAVKIQRPGIRAIVETDLEAIGVGIRILKRFAFITRRADLDALFEEFASTLRMELDYIAEGHHAERFEQNFADTPQIKVPLPCWWLTTKRILTLERVGGIKINQYDALEAAGISRPEVAQATMDAYLTQIFEDGFFHADPHPGNLFVLPLGNDADYPPAPPNAPGGRPFRLVFVDFGMVGYVRPIAQELLRRVLADVIQRDFRGLVKSLKQLGFLLPNADERPIAAALEVLFERYYGLSLAELNRIGTEEIERLLVEFREILYDFPFQVPQDFVYLGRCIGLLSGLASGLDPDFNPVASIEPYARSLIGEQVGPSLEGASRQVAALVAMLGRLPGRLDRTLAKIEADELTYRLAQAPALEKRLAAVEGAVNRLTDTLLLIVLVVSGWVIRPVEPLLGTLLWVGAAWLLWRLVRPKG
ncbi:MAG: AarF/ABC1/UbiB kinase family protein [Ardenticatenaceae bacterium]|nr:AarF/ABC1/UbiB kinase family protein [Ardenticatenaceae bacterium]